jgi:uncharacterized membrane protein YidH (DUF202 family)
MTRPRNLDHAANERTYGAWTRTALLTAAFAIAIYHFTLENERPPGPLMLVFVLTAVVVLAYAVRQYYRRRRQLTAGVFGADRTGPLLLAVMLVAFVANSLWIISS